MLQFVAMNLRPGLDEPPLGRREAAAETFHGINCEDSSVVLVVRMKMGAVMWTTASTNIRMTISKNRDSSGTMSLYVVTLDSSSGQLLLH